MTINAFSFLYSSQSFLLETGRSFSFVARQMRICIPTQERGNEKLAAEIEREKRLIEGVA